MAENSGVQAHTPALAGIPGLLKIVLSDDLQSQHLMFQLAPSRSHIIWNVGHLGYAFDQIVSPVLGLDSQLDEAYVGMFGIGSQPVTDIAAYPSLQELTDLVETIVGSVLTRLDSLSDAD